MRNIHVIPVRNPEGKRSIVRSRHRWENNFNTDLKETGCEDIDWIPLALKRNRRRVLVNTVMKNSVTLQGGKFLDYVYD
jgi:hypothetical protein